MPVSEIFPNGAPKDGSLVAAKADKEPLDQGWGSNPTPEMPSAFLNEVDAVSPPVQEPCHAVCRERRRSVRG